MSEKGELMMDKYLSDKLRIASFISIIMVVFVHAYNIRETSLSPFSNFPGQANTVDFIELFISNGVTRFAVPIFFAISGYLFFINMKPGLAGFVAKFKSRFVTLILPFLFWTICATLIIGILQANPSTSAYVPDFMKYNHTFTDYNYKLFLNPIAFQLWFLRDLTVLIALTPVIYFLISRFSLVPIIPFLVAWLCELTFRIPNIEGILFFMLGAYLAIKKINISIDLKESYWIALTILWIGFLLIKTDLAFKGFDNTNVLLILLLHKASIFCGLFVFWFGYNIFFSKSKDTNPILGISSTSFFIYAGHEPIMQIVSNSMVNFTSFGQTLSGKLVLFFVIPTAVILILISIAKVLKRYINPFYSFITGGRGNGHKLKRSYDNFSINKL